MKKDSNYSIKLYWLNLFGKQSNFFLKINLVPFSFEKHPEGIGRVLVDWTESISTIKRKRD